MWTFVLMGYRIFIIKKPAYYAQNIKFYRVVYASLFMILCRFYWRFINTAKTKSTKNQSMTGFLLKTKFTKLGNQPAWSSSILLICPIARVGLSPFGQTLTQFIIPRQRNKLNGSSRRARRACVSLSRLSAIKR